MKKRFNRLVFSAVLLLTALFVSSAASAEGEHQHKSFGYTGNTEYHWIECVGDGTCPDNWILDYGPHIFYGGYICGICKYDQRLGHNVNQCITDITINSVPPAAGNPVYTPPNFGQDTYHMVSYTYGPTPPGGTSAVFGYNTAYELHITLETEPGYRFDEVVPPSATINGQPAYFGHISDSLGFVRYTFPATEPEPLLPPDEIFSIPVTVKVQGASGATPDPGPAAFHFKVWFSDSSVTPSVLSNEVQTNGFGEFTGNIVFLVPGPMLPAAQASSLFVQQYDGNADWTFDTVERYFFWKEGSFMTWPDTTEPTAPKIPVYGMKVTNTYNPASVPVPTEPAPKPTEPSPKPTEPAVVPPESGKIVITEDASQAVITLPVIAAVKKNGSEAVPAAVFHFGIEGIRGDQEYTWLDDTAYTPGEGEFADAVSFSVPAGEQLDRLIETGFDIKERSAVVKGWSFAGEVYHISLERVDGVLTAKTGRLRNVATIDPFRDDLYFLTYYTVTDGEEGEAPSTMLPVRDLFAEAISLDKGEYSGKFTISEEDGDAWEFEWKGEKVDTGFGNVSLTMTRTPAGGAAKSASLNNILLLGYGKAYLALRDIASAYAYLSGKPFPASDKLSEQDSLVRLSDDFIDWLDIPELDELFRRLERDAGSVFDSFTVVKVDGGYKASLDEEGFESFRAAALGTAQRNHEDWYELAQEAAASEDMLDLAEAYENSFLTFLDEVDDNAEALEKLAERYPAVVSFWEIEAGSSEGEGYSFTSKLQVKDGEKVWNIEAEFNVTDTDSTLIVNQPEEYATGADWLYEIIMGLMPGDPPVDD